MLKSEKVQKINEITEKIANAKSFFLTDFSGLNVEEINDLRRKFRNSGVEYQVIKNTLARIAIKDLNFDGLMHYLEGPTAIAFATNESTAPVKIIKEFIKAKKNREKPSIKACVFEGEMLDVSQMDELAGLPSREVLISMLLGGLNSTISGLVYVLNESIAKMLRTIKAIEEKKNNE